MCDFKKLIYNKKLSQKKRNSKTLFIFFQNIFKQTDFYPNRQKMDDLKLV